MSAPPDLSLRAVQPGDDAFLFDLYAGTRREEMTAWGLTGPLLDQMLRLQFDGQRGTYQAQFPQADHHLILHAGQPVGRLYVDRSGDALVLVDITLVPAVRGRGLGTRLLTDLLAEARQAHRPVHLSVALNNPARRLYERLGFAALSGDGVYLRMAWQPPPEDSSDGQP